MDFPSKLLFKFMNFKVGLLSMNSNWPNSFQLCMYWSKYMIYEESIKFQTMIMIMIMIMMMMGDLRPYDDTMNWSDDDIYEIMSSIDEGYKHPLTRH